MKTEDLKDAFKPYVYPYVGSGYMTGTEDENVIETNAQICVDIAINFADQFKPKWIRAVANPEDEDLDIEGLSAGQFVDIWTPNHGRTVDVEYNGGVSFYDHENDTEWICCEDEVWYMPIPEKPLPTKS